MKPNNTSKHPNPSSKDYNDALLLWDYHNLHHNLGKYDAGIVLGSHDDRVAERAAETYFDGRTPILVFSGASSKITSELFSVTEAEHFAQIARQLGVPENAILLETQARNTGDNISLSRKILENKRIPIKKILLISKPYMERRAFATSKKLWPEADAHCTSPNIEFDNYINKHISFKLLVDMMVGDLQRVLEYPKQGFMIQQCVPPDVLSAYKRLIDHGYISRLIS